MTNSVFFSIIGNLMGLQMNSYLIKQSIKITTPIFFGYIAIGIPFGLMIVNAGYPWWLAPVMSLVMYTGAGEYIAVGLFAAGAGLFEFMLVQFLLGVRHIFYGLSLMEKYKGLGKYKPFLIYAVTDETFALISNLNVPENVNKGLFFTIISALDELYWVTGSLIGAVACNLLIHYDLAQYLKGVDFALTALFVVIVTEQLKASRENILSVTVGIFTAAAVIVLYRFGLFASSNIIWVSICFGLGIMLLLRGRNFYRSENKKSVGETEWKN